MVAGGELRVSTSHLRRRRVPLGTLAQMVQKRAALAQKARQVCALAAPPLDLLATAFSAFF